VIHVQCKSCGKWAYVGSDEDVHEAVDAAGCTCCPVDHHHGMAANATGSTPCRPITVTLPKPAGV